MDFNFRPYVDEDVHGLAALFNALDADVGADPYFTADDMRDWLHEVIDPERDSRIVVTPDGTLVAAALVNAPPAGGARIGVHGGVLPGWRGRALGRQLFEWELGRANEIHADVAPDVAWTALSFANEKDTSSRRLYERFGLVVQRYFFDMVAQTTGVPAPSLPDGLTSVVVTRDHFRTLHETDMEAFAEHYGFQYETYEVWAPGVVESKTFRADLSRIAYDGDQPTAIVMCKDGAEPGRVHISTVGTRAAWRGRGIASALIGEVLAAAAATGATSASLGVDATNPTGAVAIYERAGFAVTERQVSYGLVLSAQER